MPNSNAAQTLSYTGLRRFAFHARQRRNAVFIHFLRFCLCHAPQNIPFHSFVLPQKTQHRSENNHGNVPPRMQNIPFLNTHFHMCKKTHGLSRKIQGTYFKISALYFKIYALYFLPFQTSEKQRLMHTFQNPHYRLIFSCLRIFMSDCVISVKRCSIAITKFRFRTSA